MNTEAQSNSLEDFVRCEICLELFGSPQSLSCGHVFCQSCCNRMTKRGKLACPICRKVCRVTDLRTDYHTQSMVDAFTTSIENVNSSEVSEEESEEVEEEQGQEDEEEVTSSPGSIHRENLPESVTRARSIPRYYVDQPTCNSNRRRRQRSDISDEETLKMCMALGVVMLVVQILVIGFIFSLQGMKHLAILNDDHRKAVVNSSKEHTEKLREEIDKELQNLDILEIQELRNVDEKSQEAILFLKTREMELHHELVDHHEVLWMQLKEERNNYKEMIQVVFNHSQEVLANARDDGDEQKMMFVLQELKAFLSQGGFNFSEGFTPEVKEGTNISQCGGLPRLTFDDKWSIHINYIQVMWIICMIVSSTFIMFLLLLACSLSYSLSRIRIHV